MAMVQCRTEVSHELALWTFVKATLSQRHAVLSKRTALLPWFREPEVNQRCVCLAFIVMGCDLSL